MKLRTLARWEKCLVGVCLVITVTALCSSGMTLLANSEASASKVSTKQYRISYDIHSNVIRDAAPAGAFHDRLRLVVDIPGIDDPEFSNAISTTLDTSDEVIGIVVAGKAFAFSRRAMNSPNTHIINLNIDATPISITYCGLVDQTRVLAGPPGLQPLQLRVGGQDIHRQLVLLLNGTRFGQSSLDLPFKDYPFERMTLEEWITIHPDTRIFDG